MFKSNTNGLNSLKQKLVKTIMFASIGALLALSLATLRGGTVQGAPSTTLNFQARLLNKNGTLVQDGYYHIQFRIYNAVSGGTALWTESYTGASDSARVRVVNGYFSVYLGTNDSLADEADINWNEELYLTMQIGGSATSASWDNEMSPRIKLTAVPFAFQAEQLAKTETTANGGEKGTLGFASLTANRDILLPDESGTVCLQGSEDCGFMTGDADDFIRNQTTQQTGANFNIAASTGVAATIQGASGQNILVLNQSGGTAALTVESDADAVLAGNLTVQGTGNSSFAGNLTVSGNTTLGSDAADLITVNGTTTFNQGVTLAAQKTIRFVGGTTAQRPASPSEGTLYFDTDTDKLLVYSNSKWQADRSVATKIVAASNSSQAVKDSADYVATGSSDEDVINAALTAAAGGTVYLAEGTYTADGTILIPNNTTLAGAGRGTLIQLANLSGGSDNLIENSNTSGEGVVIRDLRLDGSLNASGTQRGIRFNGMGSGNTRQGGRITSVIVNGFVTDGIQVSNSDNNVLSGNTVQGNATGVRIEASSDNNVLSSSLIQANSGAGVIVRSASNNSLNGNTVQGNVRGIVIDANTGNTALNNSVTGNVLVDNTGAGISLEKNTGDGTAYNVISGNKIHNGGGTNNNGIYLVDADENTITGNDITDTSCGNSCYAINITDSGSTGNYLADNRFSDTDGSATATINDAGTNTIYSGQHDGSGNIIINPTGTNELQANTNVTGTLGVSGLATFDGDLRISDGSSNYATIDVQALGGDYTVSIPTITGNDTFCLELLGNCSAANPTLQDVYDNDTDGSNAIVTLNTTDGAILFRDNGTTPLTGTLFAVQNGGGTVDYLAVSNTGIEVGGGVTFSEGADRTIKLENRTASTGNGYALNIRGSNGNSGTGGAISIIAGTGNQTNSIGGAVTVQGGEALNGLSNGGAVNITGGSGLGGGVVNINGGTGFIPGNVILQSAQANSMVGIGQATPDAKVDIVSSFADSDGVEITHTQLDDADATDTTAALQVNVTSSSGDADTLYGIQISNLTAGAANEYALRIGSGWDQAIDANGTLISLAELQAVDGGFSFQEVYVASTTPQFVVNDSKDGLVVKNASTPITGNLLTVESNDGATDYFAVTSTGISTSGNLQVNGNTTLGDASGDAITINGTAVSIPNDLNFGSDALFIDSSSKRIGVGTNDTSSSVITVAADPTFAEMYAVSGDLELAADGDVEIILDAQGGASGETFTVSANNSEHIFSINDSAQAIFGNTSNSATLSLHDGNGQVIHIQVDDTLAGDHILTIPAATDDDIFCLQNLGNCSGASATLQDIYDNDDDDGSVIVDLNTTDGAILFRDNGTTPLGGTLLAVQDSTGSTNYLNVTATGVTTAGDLAVNGGDITSTGALNITPGGAMVLGATGQNATLQGAVTAITSNGATNDIILTSADQIILNPTNGVDINGIASVGNNVTPNGVVAFNVGHNYNGTNCIIGCYGVFSAVTATGVTTGRAIGGLFSAATTASSFTLPEAYGIFVQSGAEGSGSTITTNTGVYIAAQTVGTNNLGMAIAETGSGTKNINLLLGYDVIADTGLTNIAAGSYSIYNASTDANFFAGSLTVDSSITSGDSNTQGSLVLGDGNGQTATIRVPNTLAANTVIEIPGTVSTSDTFCLLTLNNCNSTGAWVTNSNVVNLNTDTDNVTIGSATAGGKLFVDGDTDEIQLQIQGNATQTASLMVLEQSNGTDVFTVSNAGNTTIAGSLTVNTGATISGGNISLNTTGAGSVSIGNNSGNTSIFINSGTGSINIGTGNQTKSVSIANGGGNQTVHIGSTDGSSQTRISGGTNNIELIASGSSNTGIIARTSTGSTNAFQIQAGTSDTLFRADTSSNDIFIGDADTDPTVLIVDRVANANIPAATGGALAGGIIYDSTNHKFMIYENDQLKEICNKTDLGCGAGATVNLQSAYDNDTNGGDVIVTTTDTDGSIIWNLHNSGSTDPNFDVNIASGSTGEFRVRSNSVDILQIGAAGQLQLDTQGTGGGILIGTDAQLYRSGANTLSTGSGDALTVQGLLTGTAGATISGGAINLNTSGSGAVTIGNDAGNTAVTINSGTGAIQIGTGAQVRTIQIGTGAAAQTLELGSTSGASSTTIRGGSAGVTFNSAGGILVDPTADSTDTFVIQDSASTPDVLFTANTTNNRLVVGNSTGTVLDDYTLLVLDHVPETDLFQETDTNDAGAIVYDAEADKFMVNEGGTWKTLCNTVDAGCGASGTSQDLQEAYNNSAGDGIIITSSSTKDIIFRSGTQNSDSMFHIQDSGATNTLFTANTNDNIIKIGDNSGTDDLVNTTLLVLDHVTDTDFFINGDTAMNGAIVYDAEAHKFMINENGTWKAICNQTDLGCGSAGVSQDLQDAYNNSSPSGLIETTSATKDIIFKSGSGLDSQALFQLQNGLGHTLLVADTADMQIAIGDNVTPVAGNGLLTVGSDTTTKAGGLYFGTDTNLFRSAASTLQTDGSFVLGEGADRTFGVQGRTTNAAGNSLTISAGDAGAGTTAFDGGNLVLQAGDAAGTTGDADGGNVILNSGSGVNSGANGLVVINTPAFVTEDQDASCYPSGALVNDADCTISDSSVSNASQIIVGINGEGHTATLPDPINTTAGRIVYITGAAGSSDFTLVVNGGGQGNEIAMKANTSATMIWDGSNWNAAGASSSTTLQAAYNNTLTSAGGAEIVLNNTASSNGLTIRNNQSNPITGGLLEVQSSIGTNLFSVNNRGIELAANGGSETLSTWGDNWEAVGSADADPTTTPGEFVTGIAGAEVDTTAAVGDGIQNNLSGNPVNVVGAKYQVSFTAKSSIDGTPIEVAYSMDGGTTQNACTNYGAAGAQNLSNTIWTKITCTITIASTTSVTDPIVIIRKTDTSTPTIWIDNLSFMRNDDTTNPSNVQIGGGLDGGPVTLFTLDRSSAPPVEAGNDTYLGSMYYDTITGRIQCYEADGWGACGSAPDNFVNLVPEFAGAVLNGSGVGTMTADFCSNSVELPVNTNLCSSGQALNYYRWTSPQASWQEYSIYVTYKLPAAFKNFISNSTVTLTARTDSTADGEVTYEMFRSEGGELIRCADPNADETPVTSSANIWQTVPINGNEASSDPEDPAACGFSTDSADQNIVFKINVRARNNANVYVSTLSFTTVGQ